MLSVSACFLARALKAREGSRHAGGTLVYPRLRPRARLKCKLHARARRMLFSHGHAEAFRTRTCPSEPSTAIRSETMTTAMTMSRSPSGIDATAGAIRRGQTVPERG